VSQVTQPALRGRSPVVYVAQATGQNVANLPAIFHEGRTGDTVIWLESEVEKALGHARMAQHVLKARCFRPLFLGPPFPDDPSEVPEWIESVLLPQISGDASKPEKQSTDAGRSAGLPRGAVAADVQARLRV
jgi:hypothetical protein